MIKAASGQDVYHIVLLAYEELSKLCLSIFLTSYMVTEFWMQARKALKCLFLGFLEGLMLHGYLLEC